MAEMTVVRWIDDLTSEEVPDKEIQTVEFGIDGQTYKIDLSVDNAGKLREALAEFVAHARKAGLARRRPLGPPKQFSEAQEARMWLQARDYAVPARGKLSQDWIDVYRQNRNETQADESLEEMSEDSTEEAPALDTSDDAVMAWWTGVKKFREPKNGKVMGPMRKRYLEEHGQVVT